MFSRDLFFPILCSFQGLKPRATWRFCVCVDSVRLGLNSQQCVATGPEAGSKASVSEMAMTIKMGVHLRSGPNCMPIPGHRISVMYESHATSSFG